MADDEARRARLETEIARIDRAMEDLARTRKRIPWLLLGIPLSLPAFAAGIGVGALALGTAVTLVGCAMYIVWAHGNEYRGKRTTVRERMREIDDAR